MEQIKEETNQQSSNLPASNQEKGTCCMTSRQGKKESENSEPLWAIASKILCQALLFPERPTGMHIGRILLLWGCELFREGGACKAIRSTNS
ncbi:hypothetical protein DUNSADRAFT_4583 [Dunaliella salina]|uniref:Uncharacterized protein n=1 Tax=Dunaliella salina TaxID=3046 RepID=A0ABQ7GRL2_DUNSA|nr:hypothetical protein DUNSADRAFT_4583 [Dunaliella salina]|eukprot:KAF5837256.1 hypothetical protein DUNSADRAFT_4583 [Dunaliella salina]